MSGPIPCLSFALGVIGEGRVVSSCKVAESLLLFFSVPCTGSVLVPLDIRPEMVVQLGFGAGGGATRFYGGLHLVFAGMGRDDLSLICGTGA